MISKRHIAGFALALIAAVGCGGRSNLLDGAVGSTDARTDVPRTDGPSDRPDGGPGETVRLTTIDVTPAMATIAVGTSLQLTATGRFSDGSTRDVTTIGAVWTSSSGGVVSVDLGLVRAVGPGQATITVSVMGIKGEAFVTVGKLTPNSLIIDPPMASIPTRGTVAFRALAVHADGTRQDVTQQTTWSSNRNSVARVVSSGLLIGQVTGEQAGSATITAAFQGLSARAAVTVTSGRLIAIEVRPSTAVLPIRGTVAFTAMGLYSDGSTADVTYAGTISWQSNNERVLQVESLFGMPVLGRALRAGTAIVTASLDRVTGTAAITVTPARLVSIVVSPDSALVPRGMTQKFQATGTFSDGSSTDLTESASWTTDGFVATVSNAPGTRGLATALRAGSTAVTASLSGSAGIEGSAKLTVTDSTLVGFAISPKTTTGRVGIEIPYTALATYSDGTQRDVTESTMWSVDNPRVALILNGGGRAGSLTPLSAGSTQVQGAFSGFQDTAQLVVASATIVGVSMEPASMDLGVGERRRLVVFVHYSDGTSLDGTEQAFFTTQNSTVASVSNNPGTRGEVLGVGGGETTVSALAGFGLVELKSTIRVGGGNDGRLIIAPLVPKAMVGEQVQFSALFTRPNGISTDVTYQSAWTSSNPMVAQVGTTGGPGLGLRGLATCLSAGTTTITVVFRDWSASTVLTCGGAVPIGTSISPNSITMRVGEKQTITMTALFSDGSFRDVTNEATWSSSNPMVVDITNTGMKGIVTAISGGTSTIAVEYQGFIDVGSVTVLSGPTLDRVEVLPAIGQILVGQTMAYQATAHFSDGSQQVVTDGATWSTSNTVASISNVMGSRGIATANRTGTTTVRAAYMGTTGTATLTVAAALLTSIQVTPANLSLARGRTQQYQAIGLYSDNTVRTITGQVTWASSDAMVATVSNVGGSRGLVTASLPGTTEISATLLGVTGKTTLTITSATIQEIQVTPTNPTLAVGGTQAFIATAIYSDFTIQNVTPLATWSSTSTAIARVTNTGTRGVVTGVSPGTITLSASYMGVTGTTSVTVQTVSLKEIVVTPANANSPTGVTVQFTATAVMTDNSTQNITANVIWTSTDTSVAFISNIAATRGLASALAAGSTTIRATMGTLFATTTFTVGTQQLTGITVSPGMASLVPGGTLQYTATGQYSDGSTFDLTPFATWLTSPSGTATISNVAATRGLATGVSAGGTTVIAHFQGQSGNAALTVAP